jgi:hypothetical protein
MILTRNIFATQDSLVSNNVYGSIEIEIYDDGKMRVDVFYLHDPGAYNIVVENIECIEHKDLYDACCAIVDTIYHRYVSGTPFVESIDDILTMSRLVFYARLPKGPITSTPKQGYPGKLVRRGSGFDFEFSSPRVDYL